MTISTIHVVAHLPPPVPLAIADTVCSREALERWRLYHRGPAKVGLAEEPAPLSRKRAPAVRNRPIWRERDMSPCRWQDTRAGLRTRADEPLPRNGYRYAW